MDLSTRGRAFVAVIRADWKRLKWDRYITIGDGIRKIVAMHVELELEAVSVVCSLFVDGGLTSQ